MEDSSDADEANIFPQLILILVLTLVNAFFASAELAVLSVNRNKIKRLASEGNKRAKAVEKLLVDETKFLSTIQVGITLAGFFSSATAAVAISDDFAILLSHIGVPLEVGDSISMVLVTLILSYFTLVFGELLPKRIALRNPEKVAMFEARVLCLVKIIVTPFVKLLSGSCNLLVKIFGLNKDDTSDNVSEEDIIDVVTSGVESGVVDEERQKIIESTLKFNHLTATDLMTPRVDVFMIDIDDSQTENINLILEEKYTRVPVYKKTKDNIIGIINVKDITVAAKKNGFGKINIEKIMREPLFVREHIKANQLFMKMKANKQQIALLMDEFGGFSGIVTMEDLIEEIVGNIYDEFDDDERNIVKVGEDEYIVKGSTPIQEINQELDLTLDESNIEYDTIAGFVVANINKIPEVGETIKVEYENLYFEVKDMENNRILTILLKIKKVENNDWLFAKKEYNMWVICYMCFGVFQNIYLDIFETPGSVAISRKGGNVCLL